MRSYPVKTFLKPRPPKGTAFAEGLWHGEPWDGSIDAMIARDEDNARYLARLEAERAARATRTCVHFLIPAVGTNCTVADVAASYAGALNGPAPRRILWVDGNRFEVEGIGVCEARWGWDASLGDRWRVYHISDPVPPISGGAPDPAEEEQERQYRRAADDAFNKMLEAAREMLAARERHLKAEAYWRNAEGAFLFAMRKAGNFDCEPHHRLPIVIEGHLIRRRDDGGPGVIVEKCGFVEPGEDA